MISCIPIVSRLPLRVLYAGSDYLVYPALYHILRYRRALARKNLVRSFPDKSEKEMEQIEKQFYHQLADVIVEIIYGYRISKAEIQERVVFDNVDLIEQLAHEKGGVFIMLGHLGNWEWLADMGNRLTDPNIIHYNVYRPLKNKHFNSLMLAIRAKRGGKGCIDKNNLLRTLVRLRHDTYPISIGMVADQKPSPNNAHIWTDFLHQDTAFLDGTERLAEKFGFGVVYTHITSVKRGYYRAHFEVLPDSTSEPGNTTIAFAQHLERNIQENPALWLWTHNRWKWSRG